MPKISESQKLSFIVHTKNEEKNIAACINSVKTIADEILVIDMNSSDKTVEIAKKKGAKIFQVEDMGSADPARNYGISKASFNWILYLDADERLPKTLLGTIKEIIKKNKYDLIKFPEKNIIFKKWIRHGMWWPDYHIRLFKKGYLDYPSTIHTQPKYHGKLLTLPDKVSYAIIHHHCKNIKEFLSMVDRYSSLDVRFSQDITEKGELNPDQIIQFLNKELEWRYFEHKGYLDGMHGLIISMLMNFYRFLEFAKYWEKTGYKDLFKQEELRNLLNLLIRPSANIELQIKLEGLERQLKIIQSSKFYKTWRLYHKIKNFF